MILDTVIIVLLLGSVLLAVLRGFIRETLTIMGVLGGILASVYVSPAILPPIESFLGIKDGEPSGKLLGLIPYDLVALLIAYGGLFIVVMIVLSIISHILASIVHKVGLGVLDRSLGAVFGIVRALLLLAIAYVALNIFFKQETVAGWIKASETGFVMKESGLALIKILPPELQNFMHEKQEDDDENSEEDTDSKSRKIRDAVRNLGSDTESETDEPGYEEDIRDAFETLIEDATPTQQDQLNQ